MNYRTIFLEFLANYREYHYDCIQLILFENQHNDNILKVMSDANLVDVYQVKGAQVFNKKLTFSSVNNTILNLLFITENPEIIEISKSDDEIKKFQDLYSSKTLYDLNYKYLIIYPIYQNQQLLGGLFIFSNYQLIWQIEESKLNKFIDNTLLDRLNNVVNSEFVVLDYTKAIEILESANVKFDYPVKWGIDLQSEHERYITEKVYNKPVFLTNYPKEIKAFYMRLNEDNKTVAAVDLLVPGVGELMGGSQREERLDILLKRMEECGLDRAEYEKYINLRRYGTNKHGGYGLGFERLIMYITGIQNIRDVEFFPRTVGSID